MSGITLQWNGGCDWLQTFNMFSLSLDVELDVDVDPEEKFLFSA